MCRPLTWMFPDGHQDWRIPQVASRANAKAPRNPCRMLKSTVSWWGVAMIPRRATARVSRVAWPAASAMVSGVSVSLLSRRLRAIRSSSPVISVPAEPAANTARPTVTRSALRSWRVTGGGASAWEPAASWVGHASPARV